MLFCKDVQREPRSIGYGFNTHIPATIFAFILSHTYSFCKVNANLFFDIYKIEKAIMSRQQR